MCAVAELLAHCQFIRPVTFSAIVAVNPRVIPDSHYVRE